MKGLFITGTDTDVGKTYISCLIAAELASKNIHVVPRKPVESGCLREGEKLIPHDASALKSAANYTGSLQQVCPYRFEQAISPQRAAKLSHQTVTIQDVSNACTADLDFTHDFLLVEGAGGFYSPICEDGLNADLAQKLGLPIILIAEDKVGCINHVLLTIEAISARKLHLEAIILNRRGENNSKKIAEMDNLHDLRSRVRCPVIHHAFQSTAININLLNLNPETGT